MSEVKDLNYAVIELTQGNINNDHLYLSSVMTLFPSSAIGGGSEAEQAGQLLEVHAGIEEPVHTDIAGDKKIFRKRVWVREFFEMHRLAAGDRVVVERTGPFRYHVYPMRSGARDHASVNQFNQGEHHGIAQPIQRR